MFECFDWMFVYVYNIVALINKYENLDLKKQKHPYYTYSNFLPMLCQSNIF